MIKKVFVMTSTMAPKEKGGPRACTCACSCSCSCSCSNDKAFHGTMKATVNESHTDTLTTNDNAQTIDHAAG